MTRFPPAQLRYCLAVNAVGVQMDGADSSIERWIVVLAAGGHLDDLGLDILRDDAHLLLREVAAGKAGQCGGGGDHQRRRSRNAGAGGRLGIGLNQQPLLGAQKTAVTAQPRAGENGSQVRRASKLGNCSSRRVSMERKWIRLPFKGVIRQVVRMLTAKFTVSASGWNRYNGHKSIVPPAKSARQGAWATIPRTLAAFLVFRMQCFYHDTNQHLCGLLPAVGF